LRPNNIIDPEFDEYIDMNIAKSIPIIYLLKNNGLTVGGEVKKYYKGAFALFWCGYVTTTI